MSIPIDTYEFTISKKINITFCPNISLLQWSRIQPNPILDIQIYSIRQEVQGLLCLRVDCEAVLGQSHGNP